MVEIALNSTLLLAAGCSQFFSFFIMLSTFWYILFPGCWTLGVEQAWAHIANGRCCKTAETWDSQRKHSFFRSQSWSCRQLSKNHRCIPVRKKKRTAFFDERLEKDVVWAAGEAWATETLAWGPGAAGGGDGGSGWEGDVMGISWWYANYGG